MLFSMLFPALLSLVGIVMLVKLRGFFLFHPIKTIKEIACEMRNREVRRSFFLALAGTLGVGNIFGVAAGIMIGGAGTLFWLFLSSILSMIIKYSETLLVFDMAKEREGMWGVISRVYKRSGSQLAKIYAFLTVGLALFMGAAIQTSAVIDVASQIFPFSSAIVAILLIIILIPLLNRKDEKITNATELIIPMTTIIYILMCFFAIFLNFSKIPSVIIEIVSSAFSFRSCVGGVTIIAVKEGFARGILSNEAGVGTSALAHSVARGRSPHRAGLFGMCEVFFDTTVLCMLTGFVILLSCENVSAYSTPMSLVRAAFVNSLGSFSVYPLLICIFFFAYATIICWFYYGNRAISVCLPGASGMFAPIFILFILLSNRFSHRFLLSVTDALLFTMALLTLFAVIKKRRRISTISKNG